MTTPKVLDLFTGLGGFTMAFERAGAEVVAHCEVDPTASRLLKKRFPGIPNLGSITETAGVPCNIITGGFPCQDISIAGKGAGLSGSRSGLWFEMLRIIGVQKPDVVLIENSNQLPKRGLNVILENLAEARYDAEWFTMPACAIGAPHKRERTFVIAYNLTSGISGLESVFNPCITRQWDWPGKTNLQQMFDAPFRQSDLWPQPLLRRMDDGTANRAHRLQLIGNSVVLPLIEQIAWHIVDLFHDR